MSLGECDEAHGQATIDFQGRKFHIEQQRVINIMFNSVKYMNIFDRVFSFYEDHSIGIREKTPHSRYYDVIRYFHPWKPNKTEEVEDEPFMLECYLFERKDLDIESDSESEMDDSEQD